MTPHVEHPGDRRMPPRVQHLKSITANHPSKTMQFLRPRLTLAIVAAALTAPQAFAAKASSAKPKPKPAPPALSQPASGALDKAEKIVSIGKDLWDIAKAELTSGTGNSDYAYYTASIVLFKYQDETIIVSKDSTQRINRFHWQNPQSKQEHYKTEIKHIKTGGDEEHLYDYNPFPHSWGNVPSVKSVHYPDPGKKVRQEITFTIKPTQYKLLLNLEKPSANLANLIDSAPILETLNYQEVKPDEDYETYRQISSSSFIENRPIKTQRWDTRSASIHFNAAQVQQYPLTNCATVAGDHMIHFLVSRKASFIVAPDSPSASPQP